VSAAAVTLALAGAATLGAAAGCGSPTPPPTGPIAATVETYDYTFDLESRRATAIVTARVDVAGDCLSLPLRATDLGPDVTINGAPAAGTFDGSTLKVCGEGAGAGTELEIHASMTVALATLDGSQVGYSVGTGPGGPFYYLISWVEGCDQFAPCDRRPPRFAHYHFHVTHPAGVTVLCPGTVSDAGGTTDCTFDFDGGPTYSTFGLVATTGWVTHDLGTWAGVHATIYDDPAGSITAAIDPTYEAGFLQWMTDTFGPYPYGDELRIAVGPTYWAGFEHPGNIVLDAGLTDPRNGSLYAQPVAHTLTHEMTHQWAGDQTTLAGTYDFVWKESMAEYLAYVWEDMNDPTVAVRTARAWKIDSRGAGYYPVPDGQPALFDYYGDVYGPGPMILFHQIEGMSSRAQVIAALQSLLGSPHAIGVGDVEAALETSTGLDLAAYFDAWVHGTGAPVWPTWTATWTPGTGNAGSLHVVQTNVADAPGKVCAFDVELEDAAGTQTARVPVDAFAAGTDQTIAVADPGFAVATAALDPDAKCLVTAPALTLPRRHARGWTPWHVGAPR
jgi:aminopeptidase N